MFQHLGDFKIWGSQYENFTQILNFYRCVENRRMFSCMMKDFANDVNDYDLSELGDELPDTPDTLKRFFLLSAYANLDRTGLWDLE